MNLEKADNEIAYSYDKYIEPKEEAIEQDNYEDFLIKKGEFLMEREIIKLSDLTSDEQVEKLENYVWKGEYLIPAEMIEGE